MSGLMFFVDKFCLPNRILEKDKNAINGHFVFLLTTEKSIDNQCVSFLKDWIFSRKCKYKVAHVHEINLTCPVR